MSPEAEAMAPLTILFDVGGVWHTTIALGLVLCAWQVAWKIIRPGYGLAAGLLWFWVITSALWLLEWPGMQFGINHRAYQATAGQTIAEMVLISLGVTCFKVKKLRMAISAFVLVEIGLVFFKNHGLFLADSLDMAFIAQALPFVAPWTVIAGLLAICFHRGMTAAVILVSYVPAFPKELRKYGAAIVGVVAVAQYFFFPHSTLVSRWEPWVRQLELWSNDWTNWNRIIFGSGSGSYMWQSVSWDHFQGHDLYLSMHCDWLQILFEQGLIGLGLSLAVVYRALKVPSLQYRAGVLGTVAFALFYHPLRFFPSALLTAMIFAVALRGADKKLVARFQETVAQTPATGPAGSA